VAHRIYRPISPLSEGLFGDVPIRVSGAVTQEAPGGLILVAVGLLDGAASFASGGFLPRR
ncbi:MAG: hypothetical protein ACJA0P_003799, partial [Planctomycetota bacterium]